MTNFTKEELEKFDEEIDLRWGQDTAELTEKIKAFISASHLRLLERCIEAIKKNRDRHQKESCDHPENCDYWHGHNRSMIIINELKSIE